MIAFVDDNRSSGSAASGASSSDGSTSSGSGSNSSSVVSDKDVERALANPAGMTQDFIKRILEQSDNLDPKLVKQVKERQASMLGTTEEVASREEGVGARLPDPQQEQQKAQAPQMAPPLPERDAPSPAEVVAKVKEEVLKEAFARGDNAFEGVRKAGMAGEAMLTMTNQELTGEKTMIGGKEVVGDIKSAVEGVKGLLSGMLDVNRGDSGQLVKQDSPAEALQVSGPAAGRFT